MEMLGNLLMFGVGELMEIIMLKILEVDERIMEPFFIFEVVIIMSKGPDINRGITLICL